MFDTANALRLDLDAVRMAVEFGDIEAECNSHINAARDYLTLGEPHKALPHLQQAEARYQGDVWFRWVYYPRLQAEMASYWLTQGNLHNARDCATRSLAEAERTSCRKRVAWARKLLGDIAVLEDRPDEAAGEFAQALALLDRHACPTVEWQVLRSAAAAASLVHSDDAPVLAARASAVVQSLARSIRDPEMQTRFLRAQPVRAVLGAP